MTEAEAAVGEAQAKVGEAEQALALERGRRQAVEAEIAALEAQVRAANPDDARAFGKLAQEQAGARARLAALQTREADQAEAVGRARRGLAKVERVAAEAQAVEAKRQLLTDSAEITDLVRGALREGIVSRLARHRQLAQQTREAIALVNPRASGEEATTLWSRVETLPDLLWKEIDRVLAEVRLADGMREAQAQREVSERARAALEQPARRMRYIGPAPSEPAVVADYDPF